MAQTLDIPTFVKHLRAAAGPFVVSRRSEVGDWTDDAAHAAAYRRDPELYALCALADRVRLPHRARVAAQLLRRSRAALADGQRRALDRATEQVLRKLPSDLALAVFLSVRHARANHKHTRRAIVRYLLNHRSLPALARRRRPAVVDCLEHALGRDVMRGCAKALAQPQPAAGDLTYVRRNLLRYADDPARAAAVVRFLYGTAELPRVAGEPDEADYVEPRAPERPRTATATNRGDIAATLVHLYRGGDSPELRAALDRYVANAAAELPQFTGVLSLVLDASASTRGYGEREFAVIAQSQALRLVMGRCCAAVAGGLRVFTVGGDPGADADDAERLPQPQGHTNLAGALLDALETNPDVVAIVSDGYENVAEGDLARVIASLPAAGVTTPVVFCHSMFTAKDDLSLRRPTASLPHVPEVEFWHQDDFAEVLWTVFSQAGNGKGEAFLREAMNAKVEE